MNLGRPPGRLQLVLERVQEDVLEPEFVSDAPLVRFEAYADRSRVFGWVRLDAERLTDLLNAHEELHLVNVQIEDLGDGWTRTADDVLVHRRELVAVHVSGPRGDAARRTPTRTHPIAVQSGPYLIGGHLHAAPGVDASLSARERQPMIPLTDAWIEYWAGGQRKRQWVGAIVINRDLTDWIKLVTDEDLAFGRLRHRESGA